jgi:hypothetical protein
MTLLIAVEFVTSDPAHRVALYRCCDAEDESNRVARRRVDQRRALEDRGELVSAVRCWTAWSIPLLI